MLKFLWVLALLAVLTFGCGGSTSQDRPDAPSFATTDQNTSVTSRYDQVKIGEAVARAEMLGALIHKYDVAATTATDNLRHLGYLDKEPKALGWLVLEDGNELTVRFVGKKGPSYIAQYDIVWGKAGKPALQEHAS